MAFLLGECLLLSRLKEAGLTRSEFARKMEVTPAYITGLIKGKETMSLEFAINSADILDCRVTDLYILRMSSSRYTR
ncbi:helix-turn-helix transcriptional regulator [Paenibacillus humicus]|uniref:helix-turn-helix transcriptional regulator n=1 Tax=Paenibacillus humicus TaxID=412861 RepID=UPI000FDA882E